MYYDLKDFLWNGSLGTILLDILLTKSNMVEIWLQLHIFIVLPQNICLDTYKLCKWHHITIKMRAR